MAITSQQIKHLAHACGFELAGVTGAAPSMDFDRFDEWRRMGMAGEMAYLTDHRGDKRADPRSLLPTAESIICVGKLYQTGFPLSTEVNGPERGWIARYAWGEDYHDVLRRGLEQLVEHIKADHAQPFDWKICVDTAPLLERSYARLAGLGWIGKNTCLINQEQGSWFLLGELLLSIQLESDGAPADRCGTCTRCIDACPTDALLPNENGSFLDSRLCISYLTIERKGFREDDRPDRTGNHVFGCDICQDVCPWNRRAPLTDEPAFQPVAFAPPLAELAAITEEEFRALFRHTPVWRAKHGGFLRNVAMAMGNSGQASMIEPLERLALHGDRSVALAARSALELLTNEPANVAQ